MDRLDTMRLFARIVERRSFSQAAKDLQTPRPSATLAIRQLEDFLQTRLLERTTRHVSPTPDGETYYQHCLSILAEVDAVESAFRETAPMGPLRVDVQGTLAKFFLMPALPEFLRRHPEIKLRMGEGERMVDLVQEGVDCVLRAGDLENSSLVGRRIGRFRMTTAASPAYVQRHGVPGSVDALDGHRMVAYVASTTGRPYPLEFCVGDEVRLVTLPADLCVTGAEVYAAAGAAGMGLVQVPFYRVADQLAAGTLIEILPGNRPPPMPISVLYPDTRHLPSRTRAFVDFMTEVFAGAADHR